MADYDIRYEYLATAAVARKLLDRREVQDHWESPSALAELTVAGLAGHLARAVVAGVDYLDAPVLEAAARRVSTLYDSATAWPEIAGPASRTVRAGSWNSCQLANPATTTLVSTDVTAALARAPLGRRLRSIREPAARVRRPGRRLGSRAA